MVSRVGVEGVEWRTAYRFRLPAASRVGRQKAVPLGAQPGLGLLRRFRLFLGELGADGFHLLTGCGDALAAVRNGVNQFFKASGELRSIGATDFAEQRFDFRKHADVLTVT